RHDRFRRVAGAWRNTVEGAAILRDAGLPFIVQTTVGAHNAGELEALAEFACATLRAKVWNVYFLVPTGRGTFVSDIAPSAYDRVLAELALIQARYAGTMLVNAKCAPHFVKTLLEADRGPEFLRTYTGGAGGCPAGTHYLGIRPNGDVTPCPYLPVFGGNLRERSLAEVWSDSEPFVAIRARAELGGRCGACELSGLCGGCRARAYGATGDFMAEDPLCTHTPGRFAGSPLLSIPKVEYGRPDAPAIAWEDDARERMARVPAFVRGMVVRAVESWCEKRGIRVVTTRHLDEVRKSAPGLSRFPSGG
ncbi:MAG TPA: SPASM domain-containing protein, partial [Candidatus Polarisedimenticolaceae bacterium]|nr:SPASM domain-containing protein [Candidatus Polarisedimenticolaceae bacterium]